MKKITLLVAATLMLSVSAKAAVDFKSFDKPFATINNNNVEPISFIERGIAFYVFPDGQFDFNTEPSRGDIFYKSGRRSANINSTYGAPGNNFGGGIRIEHDNSGRIRRIGNVFINYDFNDRIKRIGNVYMSYNRFALTQVGGLRIVYNRFGEIINVIGSVKGRWNSFGQNGSHYGNMNSNFNNNDSYYNNDVNQHNEDQYYYRKTDDKETSDDKDTIDQGKNRTGRR